MSDGKLFVAFCLTRYRGPCSAASFCARQSEKPGRLGIGGF